MKRSLETIGLLLEVIGLVTLLIATVWQVAITDWLDRFPANAQYYIQETANLAVIRSIDDVAQALNETDLAKRKALVDQVHKVSGETQFKLIEIRDQTGHVENQQGYWLKLIRHAIFIFGAALIIVGKACVLRHKSMQTHQPNSDG